MQAIHQIAMGKYMLHVSTHHDELVNGLFSQWFCHKKILKDVIIYQIVILPLITNTKAAYWYGIYIENQFLSSFDIYQGQCIDQNIERKYFDTLVTHWLSSHQNLHLASHNILTTA